MSNFASLVHQARLIELLWAAGEAGLTPLKLMHLHAFAYLANVLAPVWESPVLDGRVLKRRGGPYFPELQSELDHLLGKGVVLAKGLGHVEVDGVWRLE